jgi:predicted methyltransferase
MAREFYRLLSEGRPLPLKQLDQVYMDDKSKIKTEKELFGCIFKKNVVLLGDDDLMSLFFCSACFPQKITVLDVDKRIIKHIQNISKKLDFNIELRNYNALHDLPKNLKQKFDFFYTNPPYGSKNNGMSCKAFIARGIELLKTGGYGAFAIASRNFSNWANKAEIESVKYLKENGCRLIRTIEALQSYNDNPIRSSLHIFKKTKKKKIEKKFIKELELY